MLRRVHLPEYMVRKMARHAGDDWDVLRKLRGDIADLGGFHEEDIFDSEDSIQLLEVEGRLVADVLVCEGDTAIATFLHSHWAHDIEHLWAGELLVWICGQCGDKLEVDRQHLSHAARGSEWRGHPTRGGQEGISR